MRTPERVNQMNDVISGIAKRCAYKFLTKTSEELAQDLWLHVLEKEASSGKELSLDLIAKICYDKIVDIQRFDARRNSTSLDQLFNISDDNDESSDPLKCDSFAQPDDTSRIMVEDLFNLFPEGSKERLFLEYWGTASGVHDFGIKGDGKHNDGYTESDLAHKLGYAGTASRGYKHFRDKMRVVVIEFLDI